MTDKERVLEAIANGCDTADDVHAATKIPRQSVLAYVSQLHRAGLLIACGQVRRLDSRGPAATLWDVAIVDEEEVAR